MTKLEFDDEFSQLMEEFNSSAGAVERRARINAALDLKLGAQVLDVGSGPGHLAYEIAQVVGPDGHIEGVDSAEGLVEIGRRRCAGMENASFTLGDAYDLPHDDGTFDTVMSSQVFEYLDDVPKALGEMFRVLKPGGRVLIHGTGWGALLWHSSDPERMSRIMKIWDGHLADPRMPETMARRKDEISCFSNRPAPRQAATWAGAVKSAVGRPLSMRAASAGGVNTGSSRLVAPTARARWKL